MKINESYVIIKFKKDVFSIQCIFYINDKCLFMNKQQQDFSQSMKMMNHVKNTHLYHMNF